MSEFIKDDNYYHECWIEGVGPCDPRDDASGDKLIEVIDNHLFHVTSTYKEDGPPTTKTITCKKCGGTEFNVGKDYYMTVIKCVKCKWELCIHEG